VCRRYGSTLRNSCFSLFKEVLTKWKIIEYVKIRETDFHIQFPNGSEVIFLGLDDEQKLLSINDIGCVWIEEAYEVPQSTVEQLNLRMRAKIADQQIIMSWNPISKKSWLYDFSMSNPPENSIFLHSTYKDNQFLSAEYVKSIEELETRNPSKWKIYGLGEWGVPSEGLVFSNWEARDFDVMELAKTCETRCGCDLGFTDPTAIIHSLYDKENKIIYVVNETYGPGMTLDNIYDSITKMKLTKSRIYCDAADPRAISFLKSKGINAQPCLKGAGSVEARISFIQNHKLVIHPSCENMVMNLENFAYEKDKKTGEFKDSFTHEFSHAIDALGYAYSDIYTKRGLRTLDKSVLDL